MQLLSNRWWGQRRTLRTLVLGLAGGYSLICLLLYIGQERLLFFPTVVPQDFVYPFSHRFTEVFLPVEGATLAAVHFRQPLSKGVVFYLHGNGDTLLNAETIAEPFIHRGYDAFLLDYRGYGKSTGAITNEAALHRDALSAYRHLQKTYRDDQIIIYGFSLGTGLAVRLAATATPRMLILEAPFVSMLDLALRRAPYFPPFLLKYPLRSDKWIGKVRCPIYLIHGTRDDVIPFDSSERLRAYVTAPSTLIPIPGGGHGNLADFVKYRTALDHILMKERLEERKALYNLHQK